MFEYLIRVKDSTVQVSNEQQSNNIRYHLDAKINGS